MVKIRTAHVKTGFLSSVAVKVREEEDGSLELAESVTINGITITECDDRDDDPDFSQGGYRAFAENLLRKAGYNYEQARRWAPKVEAYGDFGERKS